MKLMQASNQWAARPADERYTSLIEMRDHFTMERSQSRAVTASTRAIELRPTEDQKGLELVSQAGHAFAPTNWAFGQLSQLAEAPAGYLRTLPAPIAADCVNYGLKFKRDIEDVGLLLCKNGSSVVKAATGPRYGRIWNADVLGTLVERFGDGVSGEWRVPGEFGKRVTVTQANTTLFAGDRDMFVFLANEDNRITIPNRRAGMHGDYARGFFIWNSEVGKSTFGFATFLYDYTCSNRIVWGAEGYQEIRIRHTASAPDKWLAEVAPALETYGRAATDGVVTLIETARAHRLDDVDAFLANRFGKRTVDALKAVHMLEEERPIETLWDVATAVTAKARGIAFQDERVELERQAGEVLRLAA
jgi:hypothetical protein